MKYIVSLIFIFALAGPSDSSQIQSSKRSPHGELKSKCTDCHSTKNWVVDAKQSRFKHESTGFNLSGAHAAVKCGGCHQDLRFSRIGSACIDCHTDIHNGRLGTECEKCHETASWEQRANFFTQHSRTRFPLTGAHARIACEACHQQKGFDQFANTPLECQACHMQDYQNAKDPDHMQTQFPLECLQCHGSDAASWRGGRFAHPSAFPLTGKHASTTCNSCHAKGYRGTPMACAACHLPEYNQTIDPEHRAFGFQTDCSLCHSSQGWRPALFDHLKTSGFELIGAHRALTCKQCHINNATKGLPRDCYGCHTLDYSAVLDPGHLKGNYPHDCTMCHSANIWRPATFNHNQTKFPLIGAHVSVECSSCHLDNRYAGLPTDCWSCHSSAFNGVADPSHLANNFDHNCALCHSTARWSPATFDHSKTAFPLTGAHTRAACTVCHTNGYNNTPSDCFFCHDNDYAATNNPNHIAAQFPKECTSCHNTNAWSQTTWNHDAQYFPIYSGKHRGEWNTCADCHVNTTNYRTFECINCHEHNKTDMDSKHRGRQNYQYLSTACYQCHPKGSE